MRPANRVVCRPLKDWGANGYGLKELPNAGHCWQKGVKHMRRLICLSLVFLGWNFSAPGQEKAAVPAVTVFRIGLADGLDWQHRVLDAKDAWPERAVRGPALSAAADSQSPPRAATRPSPRR